jgi:hypothetical protein
MEGELGTPPAREDVDGACIVCWQGPTDRAHLIDRSLAPDREGDPLRVVRLCRAHHDAYDAHTLDLLPFLEKGFRPELARAVEVVGLVTTLERVTGRAWAPIPILDAKLQRAAYQEFLAREGASHA